MVIGIESCNAKMIKYKQKIPTTFSLRLTLQFESLLFIFWCFANLEVKDSARTV